MNSTAKGLWEYHGLFHSKLLMLSFFMEHQICLRQGSFLISQVFFPLLGYLGPNPLESVDILSPSFPSIYSFKLLLDDHFMPNIVHRWKTAVTQRRQGLLLAITGWVYWKGQKLLYQAFAYAKKLKFRSQECSKKGSAPEFQNLYSSHSSDWMQSPCLTLQLLHELAFS